MCDPDLIGPGHLVLLCGLRLAFFPLLDQMSVVIIPGVEAFAEKAKILEGKSSYYARVNEQKIETG